ncbi:hypothetical protein TrRE_jg8532 [Triparma retinervis]|uniref:Calpain catalytic domain-containing protein n=1 Tax=Triparma retinervis TaxID=2557542 RepID=A0A9W7DVS0_9STRA|nr:hypothetical protein TrRE_jg8532 [Triparma retinervis]
MPFLDSDVRSANFTTLGLTPFEDPDGLLSLSNSQKPHFYKFARPSEIGSRHSKHVCMYQNISPYTIKQTLVTDCSFIASLCISAAYERRFRKRLVTAIIYPQTSQGKPVYNECGKYIVKLWLNGVARRVVIDDRLPVDRNYNLLCSHTKSSTHLELWVSLLEKAFLKLTGAMSYAFPGSNSGIDLYCLTGWIPERLFFAGSAGVPGEHETKPEKIWQRLHSAFSYGDCLTTASVSPDISESAADAVGLVTQHAYGVLDVREVRSGRFLFMKNPWASKAWKGRFSPHDISWNERIAKELHYDYEKARQCTDDGLYWICWDDFKRYFTSVHLNWNPHLFKYKYTVHDLWPKGKGPDNDKYCVDENPQFVLMPGKESMRKKSSFYILLSRHVDLLEQQGAEIDDFLTCFVYDSSKSVTKKITYPHENVILRGVYSGNPHFLVRIDACEDYPVMNLVIRQYKKWRDITFSLQVYSTESFSFGPMTVGQGNFPVQRIKGAFDPSGGPSGRSSAFHSNPQYRIVVKGDARGGERNVEFTVKANPKLCVSFSLLQGGGRKDYISTTDEVFCSGDYRAGVACASGRLRVDTAYTLVASTWNAGETGSFVLECAGKDVEIRALRMEGEGANYQYRAEGTFASVGCANYGRYTENASIEFTAAKTGELFGRLATKGKGADTPINFTLFRLSEGGQYLPPHASSIARDCGVVASTNEGVYKASSGGVTIGATKVKAGCKYCLVVSTFEPISNLGYTLKLYSSVELSGGNNRLARIK